MIFKRKKKEKSNEYYRDLAIQAGEEYGALVAEFFMLFGSSTYSDEVESKLRSAYQKLLTCAKRASDSVNKNK